MTMVPSTKGRVPRHTRNDVSLRIQKVTEQSVQEHADRSDIEQRLQELDYEWDIERTLEANAAGAALIGLGLGVFVSRKFLVVAMLLAGFLFQHALQGWCPPMPFFRRAG